MVEGRTSGWYFLDIRLPGGEERWGGGGGGGGGISKLAHIHVHVHVRSTQTYMNDQSLRLGKAGNYA